MIVYGCLGSNGYTKSVNTQPKVFHHDVFKNVVMGSTTTFRHIDLLKYSENLFPEVDFYKDKEIDHRYIVKTFIPNLIALFQNNIPSESETNRGANFLLGAKNKLFEIQNDYSVLVPDRDFEAVGCGTFKYTVKTGEYRYECIIDDSVSYNEVVENYKIVEQRGDIWVLEDK